MQPHKVVVRKVKRYPAQSFSTFFEKAFVNRVKRRMLMRIVKFWRSTRLVEMWASSGAPAMAVRFIQEMPERPKECPVLEFLALSLISEAAAYQRLFLI